MTRVISLIFHELFQTKENISIREKVLVVFVVVGLVFGLFSFLLMSFH